MIRRGLVVIFWLGIGIVHSQFQGRGQGQVQNRIPAQNPTCGGAGIFQHPRRCDVFLHCPSVGVRGFLRPCPEGTLFDGNTRQCIQPSDSSHSCWGGNINNNNNNRNNNRNNNNRNNDNNRIRIPVVNSNDRSRNNNRGGTNINRNQGRNNRFGTNNSNTNRRRNTNNNQNGNNRSRFQVQRNVVIPLIDVPANNCEFIQNALNSNLDSLVRRWANTQNPRVPTLSINCGNQNGPNQNQQNQVPIWQQQRG